ncbi:MAG: amidohydrolase family protein [Gemmatimonadetes bacterium]|nr:amidohydrolase family protein [Gemmatimonadota bacterium]
MTAPTGKNSAPTSRSSDRPPDLTRREWLATAGIGTAALLPNHSRPGTEAPTATTPDAQPGTVVFANTTVANPDAVRNDVALAVEGDRIAAIGPTDEVREQYRQAEVYDGRGKALFPGLINCHAHMRAVVARGFNEDFGFPNSAGLAISPASLLEGEESALMVQVAALEAIRTGTTTIVEYTGNIQRHAAVLADTGLRCVLAEGIRDSENVPGPLSSTGLAGSEAPRFSARLRDEGLQRINDLYTSWHGAEEGRITVFPAAALTETSSPELLQAVRAFAETHDLGYTIHLNQSRPEFEFMVKHHGLRPAEYLDRHEFLGPRLFAAHARYVNDEEIALLGSSGTVISHQAAMAANRGVSPPIPALRAAGCPIALGTDNNTNDVFEVMRIALVTERIRRNRDGDEIPGLLPQPEDILADATQGGARAVQQDDVLGTLEVGKKADLLVVDTQRAHLVPAGRIVSALIHSGHPGDIESVMVDGRFVMRDRTVLTMDEESIIREADAVGRRIWSRVLEAGPLSVPRLPR